MPPLSFSLPFALKRKINFLVRSENETLSLFLSRCWKENPRPFALKRKAFVCGTDTPVKVLVAFGDAANEGSS